MKLIPNWTSYKLKNDYTTKVKIIKSGNELTVFVNEQPLVGHKDFIQEGNLQIILHVWGNQPEHIVMLHSIRFWNLDEPDVLNSILAQVKNSDPTFQDDFDIFSPQPYWEDLLENQTILPKQNGWEIFGDNYFAHEMLLGNEFVIEYEYVPQNYDANIFINTCLLGDNPDFNFTFSL
ncbi:MAG: hypothetical protein IH585_17230, partial [Anaerolineaceae bacterium]|nr:hypothetical protein [Anaerolineaceae bacterium]